MKPKTSNCPICQGSSLKPIDEHEPVYWQCADCEYLFLEPSDRLQKASEKSRYEEHNNDLGDPKYLQYLEKTWQKISQDVPPGGLVVDYGCGPTKGLEAVLKGQGFQVVSDDPFFYPTSVVILNHKVDAIYCSEAIEHMYNPIVEIECWLRLLKPGGMISLRTAFHSGENGFRSWWYKDDPTHIGFFNEQTFQWLANRYSLEVCHMHSPYASFRKKAQ